MKKIVLLTALSLASLSPLACLANTASLDQYEVKYCAPVAVDRTTTEYRNDVGFIVLLDNGQLFSWGQDWLTGKNKEIPTPTIPEGRSVKEIFSNQYQFIALLDDGRILCWDRGNVFTPFIAPERKVCSIASNLRNFVAILDNGTVVALGDLDLPKALQDDINKFYEDSIRDNPDEDNYNEDSCERPPLPQYLADQVAAAPIWGVLDLPKALLDAEKQGKQVVSVTSSCEAFAAVAVDPVTSQESIISWGNHPDSSRWSTGDELNATIEVPVGTKVTSIVSDNDAFAALLDNGTVLAWGDKYYGGAAPNFPADKKVISLSATEHAFTALFDDGTIQCWGDSASGGTTPTLPSGSTITKIFTTDFSFSALLSGGENDGNILYWGFDDTPNGRREIINKTETKVETVSGGPAVWSWSKWKYVTPPDRTVSTSVPVHIVVKSVVSNQAAFAAILDDGSVLAWGDPSAGGVTPSLPPDKQVVSITPSTLSFTALFADGTIQSWGGFWPRICGGETPTNMPINHRVVALTTIYYTYMALLDDGSLFCWGGFGKYNDGQLISLPEGTKALWMASPFEKYVLKTSPSQ